MSQNRTVTVALIPHKGQISWCILQVVCCARDGRTLVSRGTFRADDCLWTGVFGSREKVTEFMAANVPGSVSVSLGAMGYDSCDFIA